MISIRHTPRHPRSASRRAGMLAFGVALLLGLLLGAFLGRAGARGIRRRIAEESTTYAGGLASELNRGLRERRRALRLLASMPSVVAHSGAEREAFAAFRSFYPEFERVGYADSSPVSAPPVAIPLQLTYGKGDLRIVGTLRADWPNGLLTDRTALGSTARRTTILFGSGGSRTDGSPSPVVSAQNGKMRWSDGRQYVTSVVPLARTTDVSPDLSIVTGVPVARMEALSRRATMSGLFFGLLLGLGAGIVAWVGVARSTRRLSLWNEALRRKVAARTDELQAVERSYQRIFENVPLGLYECDAEGRFVRVNSTLARTLGYDTPEALMSTLGSLRSVGDPEVRATFLDRLATEGEVREAFATATRSDGSVVWLSERARAVRNESGGIVSIEGAMQDATAQHELESQLRHLGDTDPLTGLLNRRGLAASIAVAGAPVSFVTLDVDHFKRYNDTNGHPAGDRALQTVAATIRATVRGDDAVARAGGEEFTVVLSRTGEAGARRVGEALRVAVQSMENGLEGRLTVSVGVATAHSAEEVAAAIAAADRALYRAKDAGRNRVVVNAAKLA